MHDPQDPDRNGAISHGSAAADLTAVGWKLLGRAHRILDERAHSKCLSGQAPLRIGISSMLLNFLVDHPANALLATATVRSDICTKIAQAFDADEIDVAMVMDIGNNRATLNGDIVAEFDIAFAWMKTAEFSLEAGVPIPLAIWPADRHIIPGILSDAGRSCRVMFEGPDYSSKLTAVRSGRCLTVVPRHAIAAPFVEADEDELPSIAPKKILLAARSGADEDRLRHVISVMSSFRLGDGQRQ
jgi:DNA-binding transcriptional LysR family regulator